MIVAAEGARACAALTAGCSVSSSRLPVSLESPSGCAGTVVNSAARHSAACTSAAVEVVAVIKRHALREVPAALRQGVFGKDRASYWRFLLDAATRYRHVFGTAVTLAIMGYHFYAVTEAVCRTD
jgi:hypothetical protein